MAGVLPALRPWNKNFQEENGQIALCREFSETASDMSYAIYHFSRGGNLPHNSSHYASLPPGLRQMDILYDLSYRLSVNREVNWPYITLSNERTHHSTRLP